MTWSKLGGVSMVVSFLGAFALARAAEQPAADAPPVASQPAATWQAGLAKVKITPPRPMWMSGYASRTHAAEGTHLDLWARALMLEDPSGKRAVLISLDLVGIDRDTSLAVRKAIETTHGLSLAQIALCCSHTHCGPVVGRNLMSMYFLDEAETLRVREYTGFLEDSLVRLVGDALANRAPCELSWGSGLCSLAVNRRTNVENDVPVLREQGRLVGPVDHDVPVLAVRSPDRRLLGVLFGYACHATTMDFYQWSGDYPGFAAARLEEAYPDCTAVFFAGCGADQNPLPRRQAGIAEQYGAELARAVQATLSGVMQPIVGELSLSGTELDIPFETLPTRAELEQNAQSANRYEVSRAKDLLSVLDSGQALPATYPYPIQVWGLGPDLRLITLGGEVVVDYAVRLKQELGGERIWVAAYANDVMAYIPSRRVWREGGYEGGGAMLYYGLPARWAEGVEEQIVAQVHALFTPQ